MYFWIGEVLSGSEGSSHYILYLFLLIDKEIYGLTILLLLQFLGSVYNVRGLRHAEHLTDVTHYMYFDWLTIFDSCICQMRTFLS